tara:strand:+ start:124 stop:630 length:507 start_codon:yes stop_codon:yes gene_type:complete
MQQFTIQSEALRDKLNSLLPAQNLGSIGVELTGSTQVIPIVDLTEVAEGSSLRSDLQTAVDFASTYTNLENETNTVLVNTTGFYRVDLSAGGTNSSASLNIFDGATSKTIRFFSFAADATQIVDSFIIYLRAGDSLRGTSAAASVGMNVITRQIADISGNLTNPQGFV